MIKLWTNFCPHAQMNFAAKLLVILPNEDVCKYFEKYAWFAFLHYYTLFTSYKPLTTKKYNKTAIIETSYNTMPNIHLRHIR